MWMSSKEAAEILGIKYDTLQKSINRANKTSKKICLIKCNKLLFKYADGVGRGGKTLQIWLDDEKTADEKEIYSDNLSCKGDNLGSDSVSGGNETYDEINTFEAGSNEINNREAVKVDKNTGNNKKACNGSKKSTAKSSKNKKPAKTSGKYSHIKTLDEKQKLEVIAYSKKYSVKKAKKFFGISDKNIYRWLKEFENGGIKEIKDRRGKRIKADLILIKQAILSIGNAHKSSWWMEYVRRYSLENKISFDPFDLQADISQSTFYRHANKLIKKDADVRNFLRGGLDALGDMNISVKRDYLAENEEWQIDATKYDFMCLNEMGEPQRYEAIGMIDAASGKLVYELAESPNSYANVRLLKKAFLKMGRPGYIKGDNGKDYVSKHFQGVLARLGVSYIAAAPFKGYQKGVIERAHGVMQNFFENLPGFIGHNAGERIKKENEALEKSKRLSGVKTNIANLLTKAEMQGMIDEYCERKSKFSKDVDSGWFDERVFGKSYERVLNAGGININNMVYQSLELYKNLKIGDSVEVIEDIDDISKMYVYAKGEFVCVVEDDERQNISAEKLKKAKKEYHKENIAPVKNYIKSLRDEKDAYYKKIAKQNLDEKMKGKSEVAKKESANKSANKEKISADDTLYLPDIDAVLDEFAG